MNTPSNFASALPSERELQRIRRKAARLRADHLRALLGRLAAFVKGRTADIDPRHLGGGRAAG
ncbi:hypothetical protein [Azospirillum formosense]|uniref:hypothetical protein n=1 Tax=Azospirillum formosense TaxID=861533 RepID=UPI00338DE6A0